MNSCCGFRKSWPMLDKPPKGVQARAKRCLQQIWMAQTEEEVDRAFKHFVVVLRDQVREGGGVPRQGPGRSAGVFQLSGQTLAALATDERDQERVREGAAADRENAQVSELKDSVRNGAAAGVIGRGKVAPAKRTEVSTGGDQRSTIQKRYSRSSTRHLNSASPTIGNISLNIADRLFKQPIPPYCAVTPPPT